MEEFNLSDCWDMDEGIVYHEEDVKEFIRRLKEITKDCMSSSCDEEVVMSRIDKLAGNKLI